MEDPDLPLPGNVVILTPTLRVSNLLNIRAY